MHVAYDVSILGRSNRNGGIFRTIDNIYQELQKQPEVALIPVATESAKSHLAALEKPLFWPRFFKHAPLISRAVVRQADIFHTSYVPIPARARKAPCSMLVHDLLPLERKEDFPPDVHRRFQKILSSLQPEDLAIVTTEYVKERLNHPNTAVIPLAASAHFYPRSVAPEPFFLTIGSPLPRKNLARVIAAAEKAKVKLIIAENVSDEELARLYSACTGFLYCSLAEGFGLPVLEAMQCGAPVVTSSTTATAEVAGSAGLLVDPTSIDEIADAIHRLSDESLHGQLREKGFARAREFSWEKTARGYIHAWKKLLYS